MGMKRTTIRTLSSGEKAYHHPPDEDHPKGRVVLIPGQSGLTEELLARREDDENGLRDLHIDHRRRIQDKQQQEAAEPAVPPDKRFV